MISIVFLRKLVSICFSFVILLLCSDQAARADSYTYTLFNGPGTPGSTYLYSINNSDQLTGMSNGQSFLYSNGGFTTLPGEGVINNNGLVYGSYGDGSYFLYNNGNATPLSKNGYDVEYSGINDAGTVVGTSYAPGGPYGFGQHGVLTYNPYTSTVTDINLPGIASRVSGINDEGTVVGVLSKTEDAEDATGLIESKGSFTYASYPDPDPLHGFEYTYFTAVNNSGQILGNYYGSNVGSGYFIYSNGVFTNLNLPTGYTPASINDLGQIAGTASLGAGVYEGFIATPTSAVPEIDANSGASAIALLAGALLILRSSRVKA